MKNLDESSSHTHCGIKVYGRENFFLLLLLFVGFFFRLSGIIWGLPLVKYMGFYHPDESKIIDGAYEFPSHILTNLDFRYPTAFHYILGIISLPIKLLPYPNNYYAIYTMGRILSVIFGTATIFVTYLLASRIFNKRCALLAAFFLTFSMLHVANSAWATTDVLSSFLMMLFLLLLLKSLETQSSRFAIITGIALGLLIGTKYTGALALIPLLILLFSYHKRRDGATKSLVRILSSVFRDKRLWIILLVGFGTFLLSTPGLLRHPFAFLASLQYEGGRLAGSYLPVYDPQTYVVLFNSLSRAIGWPLAVVSLLGILLSFFRRKDILVALVIMLLVFALYFGSSIQDRYFILVMPILAIFASSFLFFIIELSQKPSDQTKEGNEQEGEGRRTPIWAELARIAAYSLTSMVCLCTFLYSLGGVISRYPDTRTEAALYIAENIPPGSSVGLGHASKDREHAWHFPRVDKQIYQKQNFVKHPDFIILSSYDFDPIREILARGILNPDYSLPRKYWNEWYLSSPPTADIFKLNEELWSGTSQEYYLLKKLLPRTLYAPIEFPAPTIEIYARR